MKAEYQDIFVIKGKGIAGDYKSITLPFTHVSSRAIILRKEDGAILGALHRPDGSYALPGGAIDDGESAEDGVMFVVYISRGRCRDTRKRRNPGMEMDPAGRGSLVSLYAGKNPPEFAAACS